MNAMQEYEAARLVQQEAMIRAQAAAEASRLAREAAERIAAQIAAQQSGGAR